MASPRAMCRSPQLSGIRKTPNWPRNAWPRNLPSSPPAEVQRALARFDPKELRALGWQLLRLPEDSLARSTSPQPLPDLERIRATLQIRDAKVADRAERMAAE